MMIPLLPLLVDTDVVAVNSDAINAVHEWGVVVFESSGDVYSGGPWRNMPVYDEEAEAPVVWIHGEPFEGSFSVSTDMRSITCRYPDPDLEALGYAEWFIYAREEHPMESEQEEEISYQGPYNWGYPFW